MRGAGPPESGAPELRDRQVIKTEELDGEALYAIISAESGERSKESGRRLPDSAAG